MWDLGSNEEPEPPQETQVTAVHESWPHFHSEFLISDPAEASLLSAIYSPLVRSHLEDSDPCLIWHLFYLLQKTMWEFSTL